MLRYIIFGITLTIALIAGQLYIKQGDQSGASSSKDSTAQIAGVPRENPPLSVQPKSTAPVQNSAPNNLAVSANDQIDNHQKNAVQPIESNRSAWQADESAPLPPARFTNKGINPTPLKMDRRKLASAKLGDTLSLPVPQTSQDYEMSIQQVGEHQNGDKTLKGHLTDQPEYTVVVTQGSSVTYATINTPDGSFLLEADQEQGWLMAASDLDSLIDPNLVDYQIPDIERNPAN